MEESQQSMKMEVSHYYILQKTTNTKQTREKINVICESVPFIAPQVHSKVPTEAELELQTPLGF